MLLYSGGGNLLYNSGSSYVNNSVQKLVGGVIRVALGLLRGTSTMPPPAMYRTYNREKNRFLIFGWVMGYNI